VRRRLLVVAERCARRPDRCMHPMVALVSSVSLGGRVCDDTLLLRRPSSFRRISSTHLVGVCRCSPVSRVGVVSEVRYLHRIFECTCRIIWGPGTVGSLGTYTAAQIADGSRHPFPRVLGVPKKRGHASRSAPERRRDLRRLPAGSASVPRQQVGRERREAATSIDIVSLTPGTPQITPCASMWGAMKSQHGGRCKAVWSRLGVEALS